MHDTGWTVLVALHAVGATLALLLGGWLVRRRRKGDLLHRRVGRIWMVDMYWVSFSSFGIKRLTPGHFSFIHLLSIWTMISLTMAIAAARRHDIKAHRGWVVGTYFGLVSAGVIAVAIPQRAIPQTAMHAPLSLLAVLAGITALAAVIVQLAARFPAGESQLPRCSRATFFGTHIRHASVTSSRISAGDNAATQL
jgi:uncharacterized membrane protein